MLNKNPAWRPTQRKTQGVNRGLVGVTVVALSLGITWSAMSFGGGSGANLQEVVFLLRGDRMPFRGFSQLTSYQAPSRPSAKRLEGAALFWINPRVSGAGPLKMVFVSWEALPPDLQLEVDVGGKRHRVAPEFHVQGPPHGAFFQVRATPGPTAVRAKVVVRGRVMEGVSLKARRRVDLRLATYDEIWPVTRQWNESVELLYSVWIAKLFKMPKATPGGWRPLHQVIRNEERNFFYGAMGWGEERFRRDGPAAVTLRGDCADVPYMLRAYFAWKMGLPMRFRRCNRGSGRRGPRCYEVKTNLMTEYAHLSDPVERFNAFARKEISWQVHSGTTRTLPEDGESDLFPIAVKKRQLIPGTVYVDSGGHALVVTHVGEEDITAIDGHPDMSITIRRFSQRRFFPVYLSLTTGGFKAFRPITMRNGSIRPVRNEDLGERYSQGQYGFRRKRDYYSYVEAQLSLSSDDHSRSSDSNG